MLFMNNPFHFNLPQQRFITDNIYTTYSKIGNFLLEGYIGPDGSTAIDTSKRKSLMKSYAEILERRALTYGGIPVNNDLVCAINLRKSNITCIPKKYSTYSNNSEFSIDTTGTASHTSSEGVVYNSLKELIEKNALFLFWYGGDGNKITIKDEKILNSKIMRSLKIRGKEVVFFINNFFFPLKVVFSFIILDKFICSTGVGSSFLINDAVINSLNEAVLLQWKDESNELVQSHQVIFEKKYEDHSDQLKHLEKYMETTICTTDFSDNEGGHHISDLLNTLPRWIEDIYLCPLYQVVSNKLKIVKFFSPFMYNHVPIKEYLNLNNPMNKNTVNIGKPEMEKIPDCIVT